MDNKGGHMNNEPNEFERSVDEVGELDNLGEKEESQKVGAATLDVVKDIRELEELDKEIKEKIKEGDVSGADDYFKDAKGLE